MKSRNATSRHPQRGIALFTVIALLAVAMVVFASMLGNLVRDHHQCRLRHAERQCRRLAETAIARANRIVAGDAEYPGETWRVSAADTCYDQDMSVVITVDQTSIAATATSFADKMPTIRHTVHYNRNEFENE